MAHHDQQRRTLESAISDADTLLAFAAQTGALTDTSVVNAIVEIKQQLAKQAVTEEGEAKFWASFNAIAKLVRPVTAESLRCTSGEFDRTIFSLLAHRRTACAAERAVRRYRRWAVGALLILIVIQTYYLVGSAIIADIEAIPKGRDDVHAALLKLQDESQSSTNASLSARARDDAVGELLAKEDNFDLRLETNYDVLVRWNEVWRSLSHPSRWWHDGSSTGNNIHTQVASAADNIPLVRVSMTEGGALGRSGSGAASIRDKIITETKARFALRSIQSYLLPFLYGFLGTCVFILRNLASEIKARSFCTEVQYRLRMPLGALAGVAIAWFITPESSPAIVKSLSPLALAFLAGYSVEVLFTVMDRFMSAFAAQDGAPKG
jgi:hypothetical protein